MDFSFNGEPVVILHAPRAHTDGDSIVWFRRSDVLAVGDLVRLDRYPDIDVARGGSVDGLIAALDRILEITVPERLQDGGTRVIVGHGRLCNEADIVEYRDMVAIVRDRVADLVKKGHDARAGEGREAVARLRHALRTWRRRSPRRSTGASPRSEAGMSAAARRWRVRLVAAVLAGSRRGRCWHRGRPAAARAPPRSPRAAAPVDFTGYWVSVIAEDWRWRMVTPLKGDSASIPITPEARKLVDAWDPAKDDGRRRRSARRTARRA